jgi:hypothetical protein
VAQELRGVVTNVAGQPLVGASVYWAETQVGAGTSATGDYLLHRVKGYPLLVASYLGYINDTIRVESGVDVLNFRLQAEQVGIDAVVVEGNLGGNYIKREGILKGETISFAGLCKMACCNLAESFENSAAVTVGYSDAISGARQIKMLGLAGTYTQLLDENRPIMRGLSSAYGLGYTPGMWLNSIQVSKGVASVTAGHEAITGQINLEHRKPTDNERLFVNLYFDDELKPELNLSTALPVTSDKRLSTVLLAHGSINTQSYDHNMDGFRDLPDARTLHLANRWLYTADNGLQLRWGVKVTAENRLGGSMGYKDCLREELVQQALNRGTLYGSMIRNREFNGYIKLGMPVGASVYDATEQEELRSNVAMIVDFDHFNSSSYFGLNDYSGRENAVSINAMYNHYFTPRSSFIVGLSSYLRYLNEKLINGYIEQGAHVQRDYRFDRNEQEVGLYAEYTYTLRDRFSLVVGARGDYNDFYDKCYFTPRGHIKWDLTSLLTLRASAGLGYRSANPITDNLGTLATGRHIFFLESELSQEPFSSQFNRMEKALTWGGSLTQRFCLLQAEDATLSFDFFRTSFYNQVVADQEYSATAITLYNTKGASSTNTYQVDFNWTPRERLDIFVTYRYTDSSMTLRREAGDDVVVERPLVSRYKALLNLQYATRFRRWTFDATAQLNGPMRLPNQAGDPTLATYSPRYPIFFAQVSRKFKRVDLYVGCENIGNYKQHTPILSATDPYSSAFNSSVVWGPLMGRKFYAGLRWTMY